MKFHKPRLLFVGSAFFALSSVCSHAADSVSIHAAEYEPTAWIIHIPKAISIPKSQFINEVSDSQRQPQTKPDWKIELGKQYKTIAFQNGQILNEKVADQKVLNALMNYQTLEPILYLHFIPKVGESGDAYVIEAQDLSSPKNKTESRNFTRRKIDPKPPGRVVDLTSKTYLLNSDWKLTVVRVDLGTEIKDLKKMLESDQLPTRAISEEEINRALGEEHGQAVPAPSENSSQK